MCSDHLLCVTLQKEYQRHSALCEIFSLADYVTWCIWKLEKPVWDSYEQ